MSDSLKQAVEGLEVAWRRLREVLDGPDVAAALVERQVVPRPMAEAPRDGTPVILHFEGCERVWAYCRSTFEGGPKSFGTGPGFEHSIEWRPQPIGWSPVK